MPAAGGPVSPDYDVAILGGGCAGLSLAVALAERAPSVRVCVLEAREQYARDRTWCFWNTEPHAFTSCVTHQWNSWQLSAGGRDVRCQSLRYCYQHLPSDRFYAQACASMERASGQWLALGVQVAQVIAQPSALRIETSSGALSARYVFDSRPPGAPWTRYEASPASGGANSFIQRFVGWHVRTTRPCFDPTAVHLMDFCAPTLLGRTVFYYVLPFSVDEALIEVTYLDRPSLPPADAAGALRARLEALSTDYKVLYCEEGALPMQWSPERATEADARIVPIGARGGRIRPSSGYAFLRIQRQSRSLADAIALNRTLPARYEPQHFSLLDRVFLAAMQQNPAAVPEYFMKMFERVPPDRLVRFLSETSSPWETLQTAAVLPKTDFAAAAWTQLTRRTA